MTRNEQPTFPPGPDDADADAFADACRENEWSARLDNLARLHTYEARGSLDTCDS